MSSLSSLSNLASSSNAYAPSISANSLTSEPTASSTRQASSVVTFNSASTPPVMTYEVLQQRDSISFGQAWTNKSTDALSNLIARNFSANGTPANRFNGLGHAMLDSLKRGSVNFKQSVVNYQSSTRDPNSAEKASKTQLDALQNSPQSKITLSIQTRSGTKIDLTLVNSANGLGVEVSSSAELSQSERDALSQLADGFDAAIAGATDTPPHINIEGLTKFDSNVLSSIDFQSSGIGTLSLEFHADATQRNLKAVLPTGKIEVNVDLSAPSAWGNAAQRQKAVTSYLAQFDKAGSRGSADKELLALFKESFAAMHKSYPSDSAQATAITPAANPIRLQDQDRALLTGLADFKAKISVETTSPNPMRTNEVDAFSYETSQSTQLSGSDNANRSITQKQSATLKASFHQSLFSSRPPMLTDKKASQNYRYIQIEDQASSQASIAYKDDHLSQYSLEKSAKQSTHIQTYELGKLTDERNTPYEKSVVTDLLDSIERLNKQTQKGVLNQSDRQFVLDKLNSQIFLDADPYAVTNDANKPSDSFRLVSRDQ